MLSNYCVAKNYNWSGSMLESKGFNGGLSTLKVAILSLPKSEREKLAQSYDIKKLVVVFEDEDMLATCQALFDNNLNVSLTARKMYMHRNTLIYRLNKIKKITGLDVTNFSQAVTFIILHMIYLGK
jgi:carbohydrate diacid regulator